MRRSFRGSDFGGECFALNRKAPQEEAHIVEPAVLKPSLFVAALSACFFQ